MAMPHTTHVSPSTKGSKPVSEILRRLQVQDPRQVSTTPYGRRITDYESRKPVFQTAFAFILAALVAGGLWSVLLQDLAGTWNTRHIRFAAVESLNIPAGLHPFPQTAQP